MSGAADVVRGSARFGPVVRWVFHWGVSIVSFVSGVLALFVFRRELPHVGYLVGYVLLLWLLFAVLTQVRQALEDRGRRFVVTAGDYAIQSLFHGLLLFLLPAYWASTTLTSPNVIFLAVLAVLVLLATFDPAYQALVHPRPWLGLVFFVISIFGALNVALPLIGVRPDAALLLAAWAAIVALAPSVRRRLGWRWGQAFAVTGLCGLAVAAGAWTVRVAIPPAPLSLARGTVARGITDLEPVDPLPGSISERDLRAGGLVAYTAVYAPSGLRQPIVHVWRHEGAVASVVALSPVHGGRRQGFRTYSRKTTFPREVTGRWSVDVVTTSGQLIGRLRFTVTP